ncbi:MAG: hypothetical protein JW915_07500 [Chitinispirillaceae bacterium]|nr:hypothetical protein [Chitinispirillaceae bacterium]
MQCSKKLRNIVFSTLPLLFFFCSTDDKIVGTVDDTDTGISVYLPDNTPAVDAVIKFIPSTRSQTIGLSKKSSASSAVAVVRTDACGKFKVPVLADSTYNIFMEKGDLKAFQGEVVITSQGHSIQDDTLRKTGSFTAFIGLDPKDMHNVGSVAIQILGSDVQFTNPDKNGLFTFEDIAAGSYKLRLETSLPEYSPTYFTMPIQSGTDSMYPDTIFLKYTGIPSVTGLSAVFDTSNGIVRLSWNSTEYSNLLDYIVFRDTEPAVVYSKDPYKATFDTTLFDTIYKANDSQKGTQSTVYKYRVAIRNNSTDKGSTFGAVSITAIPFRSALVISAGLDQTVDISSDVVLKGEIIFSKYSLISQEWKIGNDSWVQGDSAVFKTNNDLSQETFTCIYRVADSAGTVVQDSVAVTKKPLLVTLGKFPSRELSQSTVVTDYRWTIVEGTSVETEEYFYLGHIDNGVYGIWSTSDFKSFNLVTQNIGTLALSNNLLKFKNNYYIYGNSPNLNDADAYTSTDTITWSKFVPVYKQSTPMGRSSIVIHNNKMFRIITEGSDTNWTVNISSNGVDWDTIQLPHSLGYIRSFFKINGSLASVTSLGKFISNDDGVSWQPDNMWDSDGEMFPDNISRVVFSDSVTIISYTERPTYTSRLTMFKNGAWKSLPHELFANSYGQSIAGNRCILMTSSSFSTEFTAQAFKLY